MVELADTLDLGSSIRKDVGVQVPSSVPYNSYTKEAILEALKHCKTWADLAQYFDRGQKSGFSSYIRRRMLRFGITCSHLNRHDVYTEEKLREAIAHCSTWALVCEWFKVDARSGTQSHLARRAKSLGIDTSHFKGKGWAASTTGSKTNKKKPVEEYLVLNGPKIRNERLKSHLINAGIKKAACEWCGLSEWLGVKIWLELDHINRNIRDTRLDNLQILCPNCHTIKTSFDKGLRSLPQGWTERGPNT